MKKLFHRGVKLAALTYFVLSLLLSKACYRLLRRLRPVELGEL